MESLSNHMSSLGTLTSAESLSCLFRTCVSIALLFTQMWLTIFVIQVFSIIYVGSTFTMSSSMHKRQNIISLQTALHTSTA